VLKLKDIQKYIGINKISLPKSIFENENFKYFGDFGYFLFITEDSHKLQGLVRLGKEIRKDKRKNNRDRSKNKESTKEFKHTWKILCDMDQDLEMGNEEEIVGLVFIKYFRKLSHKNKLLNMW